MAKVLKADASAGNAFAEIDLGSGQPEVWKTSSLLIPAATLAAWDIPWSPNLMRLFADDHSSFTDGFFVSTGPDWGTSWGSTSGTPGPVADAWMLCEFRHVAGGAFEFYVDAVLIDSGTEFSGEGDTRFVSIGPDAMGAGPSVVYYADVKVGTTRGASDLFADDFASGDLSAWTSSDGDVSVVDDPLTPPPEVLPDAGVLVAFTDGPLEPDPTFTRL